MCEPIMLHIDGHAYSNQIPVDFVADDVKAWMQAFDHVVRYVAPHGLTFVLYGRGYRVRFHDGVPVKPDVDRLCHLLRMYQRQRMSVAQSRLAA